MVKETTQHYLRSSDVSEKLLSSIDNGILILDSELCVIYFNKWLEIHTSLTQKDVLNKKIDSLFNEINTKILQRKINTALRMNSPTFYSANTSKYLIPINIKHIKASNYSHMRQDVSIIPFDTEKRYVALIITDQTNMANTNDLLEQNIQKVKELNNELLAEKSIVDERVLFLKIDKDHKITNSSNAYLKTLKAKKEDIFNKKLFELEKDTTTKELKEKILKHMEQKRVFSYDKLTLTKDKKELWLHNTLVPDYDKNGLHIGFVIFSEDITDAKLIQEHQEKMIENSRATAMGEMISMIAHQWRQPLSVINTIIAMLKLKQDLKLLDDKSMQESFDKIEKTVSFLSQTIDDFRNFFKKNKELSYVSIKEIFTQAKQLLDNEMIAHRIEYIDLIDDANEIDTYKNELIQSIINILKNSIDAFSENKIETPILQVKSYENEKFITIEIEDNAGGIPQEIIHNVIEPYFSTKSKNGTGLGLYVCKMIIEDHLKGRLSIISKDSKTKTVIELPKNIEGGLDESSVSTLQ